MNWQTIDTAPKTGRILVTTNGRVKIAEWNDQKQHSRPKPYWQFEGSFSVTRDRREQPSHWMPLPEACRD
jgi:hypothetical protein